ncbi:hypothetical protein [Mesorhizobium sp. CAU 1741]|uniref:hypothetical protein n=1 Tax=Mesorhizobium sp. CAU 1741 TaxID=3140366 RepID=UPI00325BDF0A
MTEATTAASGEAASEIELRLRWRQTWPDKEAHYTAYALGFDAAVGYIFLIEAGDDQREWLRSMTADDYEIARNCGPTNGVDRSARHAASCVEDAWFAAIRGTRHDRPVKVNAYAAARHRHEAA